MSQFLERNLKENLRYRLFSELLGKHINDGKELNMTSTNK